MTLHSNSNTPIHVRPDNCLSESTLKDEHFVFLINFYIHDNFELSNLKNYIKLIKGEYIIDHPHFREEIVKLVLDDLISCENEREITLKKELR
jgi:hypothetical protein